MTKDKSTAKAAKRTPGSPATAPRRTPGAWTKHSAAALESVQANIFVADTDFVIVYANPSAKETLRKLSADFQTSFAIDVENLVGHSIHRFHRDPQRVESILRDPAALPHQTEFAFGGVTLQARINAVRDDGDRVVSYVVAWEDVTERRRLELDSAGQIAAMRRVQAVIEFKLDGSIVDANDCFLKAMGYELDEIKGRHHRLFVDPKEAGSEKYRQFWLDLAEGKRKFGRFRRLGKSGQEVWIEGSYFPILDASGKPFKVVKYATDVTQLKNVETSLESTAQTLASAGHELTAVSQQMASNSEETAAQASVVSAAAEQVSRNVESVAGAVEEMGASIKEIAKNANDAARVATSAVKIAEKTNSTVSKLGESSAEIGAVIKVITSIAQQTNLLALNATIEAARAGDAGKGFAVVANEVKELAKQTAKATEDIGRKIEAIQSDTRGAVDAIAQIGAVIGQMNDIQTAIAGAVEQQTATTSEIARNVSEAALGSREIAENVTAVAQAARETTEGAANTKTSADELSRLAAELLRLIATLQE